jgi:hypothetical protein
MRQVEGSADRRLTEQHQCRMGDRPFSCRKLLRRAQSELVMQNSSSRIGVRIIWHLRLPVSGHGPSVQFGCADLAFDISRDLAVMVRAERPRQFDLYGLSRGQGVVEARMLTR